MLFIRGNAISGAPIIIEINQFPNKKHHMKHNHPFYIVTKRTWPILEKEHGNEVLVDAVRTPYLLLDS